MVQLADSHPVGTEVRGDLGWNLFFPEPVIEPKRSVSGLNPSTACAWLPSGVSRRC